MSEDFGSGVSRTLSALERQFGQVVWAAGKPPLDSELNLMGQIEIDRIAQVVRSNMHSGFLLDPMDAQRDFQTEANWSNFFKLGRAATGETAPFMWANVNGWLLPVTGTSVSEGDPSNRVDLWPPPASDTRIDLVFLEAWMAQVAPNPSAANKPAADKIWRWGNVKYGGTNITDDIEDPTIGFETTERMQIQYRIRVFGQGAGLGSSVSLDNYPDGLDDPNVLGQGAATAPVTGFNYTNMRDEMGDPGLWRAGDGDATNNLGTVDGYTYAIPIAALFRRNSDSYVARTNAGNANQNGSVDRNPITAAMTDPAEGTKSFLTATLTNDISELTTGVVQVDDLVGSALENGDIDWTATFLMLGDEVISIESVDTGASPATMTIRASGGRGRWGTMAVPHSAGTSIQFFNWRHDGLFADQIASNDILDLRKGVTMGEWDYNSLLAHNFSSLVKGQLRSSYKQAGISDTQGPVVVEVDTLHADGTNPNQTEIVDGPDGIRTIFSDGATIQPDVTMLLDDPTSAGLVTQYDTGVSWDVAAQFLPGGFSNGGPGWTNGSTIYVHIGGSNGSDGARETFSTTANRFVRFLMPQEYWKSMTEDSSNQNPLSLRFLTEQATIPAAGSEPAVEHPGPMYPLQEHNFEYPYIVLGGILNSDSQSSGGVSVFNETAPSAADWEVEISGLNFDTPGDWFAAGFPNDPSLLNKPVLHGSRTLWGMLTRDGQDLTGASSEVYLVIQGDTVNADNNGCFRVVGAGTVGYTTRGATAADRLRVEFVNAPSAPDVFVNNTGLTAELRSQYAHSEDGLGFSAGVAAMCIVLTDIEGETGGASNPWNTANLGALTISAPVASKMVLSTTLQYHPGRSGTARVADAIDRFAVLPNDSSPYLRQSPASIDPTFPTSAGVPDDEIYFDLNHIQTWNRLSSQGLTAPNAPSYGGAMVGFSEQDREAELFLDAGSKTILFRPFLDREMTLQQQTLTAGQLVPSTLDGSITTDGAGIFAAGLATGYGLPAEFMPRFGRQDIPFFVDTTGVGSGTFLQGLNHMFTDSLDNTQTQFNIVGGEDNLGSPGILSIRIQAGPGTALSYGQWGLIPSTATNGYEGRLYSDNSVQSSDVGTGLEGIQLPPFLGVARVYGVYDLRDYAAAGGATFLSNRITPVANPPANLLRTDASKQTVFIVEGGAQDITNNANDHTYVIPEDAINIELSNNYVSGETFSDLGYVVECVVFGFARGFINQNNYVIARQNNGEGNPAVAELEACHMTIPAPAPINDEAYSAYNRTVYQGDPYMTRDGDTRTVSDYEHRYGQIDQSDAYAAKDAIQQFDSDGNRIPETVNARAVEILAAMDFWTTLGTGKIGGTLYGGTPLDVGFVSEGQAGLPQTRIPGSASADPWQVSTRAFTEGQKSNRGHAQGTVVVASNASLSPGDTVGVTLPDGTTVTVAAPGDWTIGADEIATASSIAAALNAKVELQPWVTAYSVGQDVQVQALAGGADGNDLGLAIVNLAGFRLRVGASQTSPRNLTNANLQGGTDIPMNAALGANPNTPIKLTGMTERLPLGLLLQDSDFVGEDPLRDASSLLNSSFGSVASDVRNEVPLTGGEEYTRVVGGVGTHLGMADGSILRYSPYSDSNPTGTRRFRLYRGGGSAYVISGDNPGGPADWVSGAFPDGLDPVLKSGILVGRAFLVRNYPEEAFSSNETTTHGDELQMVIVTQGILGKGSPAWAPTDGLPLSGSVGPTGYGEGYAAADRYRLEGKPFSAGHSRQAPDLEPDIAFFPFDEISSNAE